ncbi:MAG TPA: DNRLRE domain-containing protein [Prolixibacteraceae bacterium]|nr:DNRLRE domain-containing protein [Prolixibacteraceae bacterium]
MKEIKIFIKRWHFIKMLMISSFLIILLAKCEIQPDYKYEYSNPGGKLNVTAWEYIQQTDSLSLMEAAITAAGMQDYFSGSAEYTFIIPRNSAFRDYLKTNKYNGLSDIPVPILKNVLLYHIVKAKVLFSDPALSLRDNPIAYDTENGQVMYLSHNNNYNGLINQGTNKSWTIITSNLEATNGAINISSAIVYYSAVTGSTDVPNPTLESDTIYAIQDTYVRAGTFVDNNFGAADDLTLRGDIGSSINDRKVFLMFDLSEITTSGILREAHLNLGAYYAAGKGANINLYNVQDITWAESGITWNNMPSPDTGVFSSTVSTPITYLSFGLFTLNCTDYLSSKLASPGKVSILIDAEHGTNDGIMFVSKENSTYSYPPMLVAVFSSGNSTLAMGTNTGLTVSKGGLAVLSKSMLEMAGAAHTDIVYKIESIPSKGWLVMGSTILKAGSKFTQLDIDVKNIVYIHSGADNSGDSFSLSVKDRDGGSIDPFNFTVKVQ